MSDQQLTSFSVSTVTPSSLNTSLSPGENAGSYTEQSFSGIWRQRGSETECNEEGLIMSSFLLSHRMDISSDLSFVEQQQQHGELVASRDARGEGAEAVAHTLQPSAVSGARGVNALWRI